MGDTTSVTHSNCGLGELHLVYCPLVNGSTLGHEKGLDTIDVSHVTVSIGILNDDVLLSIFDSRRLANEVDDDFDDMEDAFDQRNWNWDRQRWWRKLTQVCRRWRSLILASPSRLNLHVVCTKDAPLAVIPAHFLHLPLVVIYGLDDGEEIPPGDERNILLSLQRHHHVRRVFLRAPAPVLQKMIVPLDDEFPLLDSLAITSTSDDDSTGLIFPRSLRAPNLRHLILVNVALRPGTPILTTPIHLVALVLQDIPTSAHIPPECVVDLLEFIPQLKMLSVGFRPPIADLDVGTQLVQEAQKTFITLHCLKQLQFRGASAHLEGLLARINAPILRQFYIRFPNQRSFGTLPNLSRFLDTTTELRFRVAEMNFHGHSVTIDMVNLRSRRGDTTVFRLRAKGNQLDWQIASASRICRAIVPVLSVTDELIFSYRAHELFSDTRTKDIRAQWLQILGQFGGVETLRVASGLAEELSFHLQSEGEEPLLGLLPRLEQIEVPAWGNVADAFAAFIDSRRIAGHPVNLVRKS
ncbi:hypothetical protein EDB85DRAFT_1889192 [Lactarius pseudohatsudake]|nr:hypothetical protein EDB85DRAFT_1889192 [Lactarius pseudohatsudake]